MPNPNNLNCAFCESKTSHVLVSKSYSAENSITFALWRCTVCKGEALSLINGNHNPEALTLTKWEALEKLIFPTPQSLYVVPKEITNQVIRSALSEAANCILSGSYHAAVGQCRRAIQAVIDDLDAKGNTLAAQFKSLFKAGIILKYMVDMQDVIKTLGNWGVHNKKSIAQKITAEDAAISFEFAKSLIDSIYIKPNIAEKVKKEVEDRKGSA